MTKRFSSSCAPGWRGAASLGLLLAGCAAPGGPGPRPSPSDTSALLDRARQHFAPLGAVPTEDPRRIALGRRLFFETRVSADGQVGCVTCHLPQFWGTDGLARARGVFGRTGERNSPTVLNAGRQASQHWRGERESLEDEATGALLGPVAYGLGSNSEAVARLNSLEGYPEAFASAFPGEASPVSVGHWGAALAAYQRSLVTPAPVDEFLNGKASALSPAAQAGLAAFLDLGCARCHRGALFGGETLERFGEARDYHALTGSAPSDHGRLDITKAERDRDMFKVAPLRNVARTGPYFHDGSVASLPRAVQVMALAQLGRELPPDTLQSIVAFLDALSGQVPPSFAPPWPG